MCDTYARKIWTDRSASQALSKLIRRELDVEIDPVALRYFVKAHWERIKLFGHAIHGPEVIEEPAGHD